jgi:hypothetical protein
MKMNLIALSIVPVSLIFGQASYAKSIQIAINQNLENLHNAPLTYYLYSTPPTQKAIADNAKTLWNNLNKHTDAQLDLKLLSDVGSSNRIQINTDNVFFDVFSPVSMGFIYTKSLTKYLRPKKALFESNRVPDKSQCVEMAKNYLSRLEILPSETEEMYIAKVGKVRAASYNNATKTASEIYDMMRVVHFGRKLDGLPVHGASRIVVRLGDNGELVGIIKNWPKLVRVTVNDATKMNDQSKWKDVISQYFTNRYTIDFYPTVNVETTELVMFDDGQGCIEPALHAKGKLIDTKGIPCATDWVIPIMTEPKAKYKAVNMNSGSGNSGDIK